MSLEGLLNLPVSGTSSREPPPALIKSNLFLLQLKTCSSTRGAWFKKKEKTGIASAFAVDTKP